MTYYTYEELREQAIKQGIRDNKVHIGIWIHQQGYIKTSKQQNLIKKTYYWKI